MLEITVLASGSAGNSVLVRCGTTTLLIDAGLSARRLRERLSACHVTPESLDGILLTHEHGDHTGALNVLCAKTDIPLFANRMTATALSSGPLGNHRHWRYFSKASFSIGDCTIESFSVPHDAVEPVGFLVHNATATFGLVTDLGHTTPAILERLRHADALFVETNHDEDLLAKDERRPWSVKQRILSRHGHLSNAAAAQVVSDCTTDRLRHVFIGHLSRDCNTPDLATAAITGALVSSDRSDVAVHCSVQETIGPSVRLGPPAREVQATLAI
ncbi:MAG: MBL fold metallo-hydrolase [Chthoniobacterales bacterium]